MKRILLLTACIAAALMLCAATSFANTKDDGGPPVQYEPSDADSAPADLSRITVRRGTLINDGGFENGPPPASAWTIEDTVTCDAIDSEGVYSITPYEGKFMFWGGGFCNEEPSVNSAMQKVSVPEDATQLVFYLNSYRSYPDDGDHGDYFAISVDGNDVFTWEMTKSNNTKTWQEQSVDIAEYAGNEVELKLYVVNGGMSSYFGHVFIDNISFYAGTAPPPPPPGDDDYTHWWYVPNEPGTGLSMELQNDILFLVWYVYDTDGRPIWYVSWAEETATDTYEGTLRYYTGWELGDPWKPASPTDAGTITVAFSDADHATLSWDMGLFSNPGSKQIEKYMPTLVSGSADPREIDGWWIDNSYSGMGFFFEAYGDTLFMGWYNYRSDLSPRWWTLGGWLDPGGFGTSDTTYTAVLQEYTDGQTVGGPHQGATMETKEQVQLKFTGSGDNLSITLEWKDDTFVLQRYTFSSVPE